MAAICTEQLSLYVDVFDLRYSDTFRNILEIRHIFFPAHIFENKSSMEFYVSHGFNCQFTNQIFPLVPGQMIQKLLNELP